jgi:hypothetical protein
MDVQKRNGFAPLSFDQCEATSTDADWVAMEIAGAIGATLRSSLQ